MPRKKNPRREAPALRVDVREALEKAFPENLVEMWYDSEDGGAWFSEIEEELGDRLRRLKGVALFHEIEPEPESPAAGVEDEDEWLPEIGTSRSYHLYFLSPAGKPFEFTAEIEDYPEVDEFEDEGGGFDGFGEDEEFLEPELNSVTVEGRGRTGWSVAVSLVAPFAVITLSSLTEFENGAMHEPGIETVAESLEGGPAKDPLTLFGETADAKAVAVLTKLRNQIEAVLERQGITVLPEEEWRKPVPWLSPGEETLSGRGKEAVTVLDALFFEML